MQQSTKSKQVSRKKTTQDKIVEKAKRLIWVKGYEGMSLNDLVAKAGVSKGAFFHYYPNKQAISAQVIDQYVREELIGVLEQHLSHDSGVKNALLNWIEDLYERYKVAGFNGGCLLGNLALELSDQNMAAREQMKQHFLDLENCLVSALRSLESDEKLLIEPRQFSRLMIAALQGVLMMGKVHKDQNRAGREFMALAQMIEYMIKD